MVSPQILLFSIELYWYSLVILIFKLNCWLKILEMCVYIDIDILIGYFIMAKTITVELLTSLEDLMSHCNIWQLRKKLCFKYMLAGRLQHVFSPVEICHKWDLESSLADCGGLKYVQKFFETSSGGAYFLSLSCGLDLASSKEWRKEQK